MPRIISFTKADRLQTITMDPGIYPSVISEINGPQVSKSGKGQNYWTKFRITDGKYAGKELSACFCTSIDKSMMAGNMQMYPDSMFEEVNAAINGTKPSIDEGSLDIDELINKNFCIAVGVVPDANGGKLNNTINAFLPAGTDKQTSPF